MIKYICTVLACLLSPTIALPQAQSVKMATDRGVSWLVEQQNENGSYGESVSSTAITIYAMAVCPRKYREDDGPFMRLGVKYLLNNLNTAKADKTTLFGVQKALKTLKDKKYTETINNIEKRLEQLEERVDSWTFKGNPDGLFQTQLPNGSWENSIEKTSHNIIWLSLIKQEALPNPTLEETRNKGVRFLLSQRTKNVWGIFGEPEGGITGLTVSALLAVPGPRDKDTQEAIESGLEYLRSLAKPNGAIFDKGYANYSTSVAVMAFVESGKEELKPLIEKAQGYLLTLQADESKGYRPDDKFYGGMGYGSSQRTDLSNLQFAFEALSASELPKDHEAYQKALVFLSRSQNYSETNTFSVETDGVTYVPGNDGGGIYYPGTSMAGYVTLSNGQKIPRSYGSMTYALLRGYLFAGLAKDDPRLKAAVSWIQKNYTVHENPGFDRTGSLNAGMQGYFYYLLTMAKALDALGIETITTGDGLEHSWRQELKEKLISLQKPDGSWVNEFSARWWEGNPVLATSYALATLKYVE